MPMNTIPDRLRRIRSGILSAPFGPKVEQAINKIRAVQPFDRLADTYERFYSLSLDAGRASGGIDNWSKSYYDASSRGSPR